MDHATLRRIAAATAVVMDEFGGNVDVFFLMKALYRADRRMLEEFGRPITGDRYSSMPMGPILCETYDLVRGKSDAPGMQDRWNEAFSTNQNTVTPKGEIDRGPLAPVEEGILRDEALLVRQKRDNRESVAEWMHQTCPEWERVPAKTSKPLPIERILRFLPGHEKTNSEWVTAAIAHGGRIRSSDLLSDKPLLLRPN